MNYNKWTKLVRSQWPCRCGNDSAYVYEYADDMPKPKAVPRFEIVCQHCLTVPDRTDDEFYSEDAAADLRPARAAKDGGIIPGMELRNKELGLIQVKARVLPEHLGYWQDIYDNGQDLKYKIERIANEQAALIGCELRLWGLKYL